MTRLCLGTVQFGMKYGINNTLGQPSIDYSVEMLAKAVDKGIRVIDTARAYGTAELVVGRYIQQRGNDKDLKIISKLKPNIIEAGERDIYSVIRKEFEDSLQRLCISRMDGYLLHTPQYIRNSQIVSALERLKAEKLTDHIGVSIYEIEDGISAVKSGVVDYIQLPYSVLDQRGFKEKFIPAAQKAGITIFARSAFLQGLFFMDKKNIPQNLSEVIPYLEILDHILEKYQIDKVSALIKFVTMEKDIDYLVFGVDTMDQLVEDIDKYHNTEVPLEFINEVKSSFQVINKSIIFPSLWSNGKKAE